MMIENTVRAQTGHLQIQAPGYKDGLKMRQVVPGVAALAADLRRELGSDEVAARASAFALVSSEERSYGLMISGVEPQFEARVSSLPGLVTEGRFLDDPTAGEIVIGSVLSRNLRAGVGDELTFSYTITIHNTGGEPAKLLRRHWVITDANGKVEEVSGEGVVGEQPYLKPGEAFRYTSGAMLDTPVGSMEGEEQTVHYIP